MSPSLSKIEKQRLPYPPDLFSGARDVQTPFGNVRVYEWGPEYGHKVLFVHGISTPCLSLGLLAEELVASGCRVMLFDLFGRGYSDDPKDLNHDARLYISQILLVLASSPLPWTGTNAFSIVGYSLGGGISAAFTDAFPRLVASLILLTPSGLVRKSHIAWSSRFLYQTEGILPETAVEHLVKRRLLDGTKSDVSPQSNKPDATSAVAAEAGADTESPSLQAGVLYPRSPQVTISAAVHWQIQNHQGFIPAFISSIRHAPIMNQHQSWRRIGARLTAQNSNIADDDAGANGMWRGKVLLIVGKTDPIIIPDEIVPDAEGCFGNGNLETVVIDGGHDIPTSHVSDVSSAILKFWKPSSE